MKYFQSLNLTFSFFFTGILFGQVAPAPEPEKPDLAINFVDADDELLLNYSINLYAGYPIYTAEGHKRKEKTCWSIFLETGLGRIRG